MPVISRCTYPGFYLFPMLGITVIGIQYDAWITLFVGLAVTVVPGGDRAQLCTYPDGIHFVNCVPVIKRGKILELPGSPLPHRGATRGS